MGWGFRGLRVAKLGLNGVGVAGVRGRKTGALFLPKVSLTTRNSQFGWLGLGVSPKVLQKKLGPKPRNFDNEVRAFALA